MKKVLFFLTIPAILIVLTACAAKTTTTNTTTSNTSGSVNTSGTAQNSNVTIKNFAFSPATITVKAGTTVVWTNEDSATHTVNSATFNSGNLGTGQTFSQTFSTPGTFNYSCGIHPSMKGVVIVQ